MSAIRVVAGLSGKALVYYTRTPCADPAAGEWTALRHGSPAGRRLENSSIARYGRGMQITGPKLPRPAPVAPARSGTALVRRSPEGSHPDSFCRL